ncbi:MAG: cytochrome c [Alphaproteobacteria bacterium]|nr:cytochrome c [Alphaproteobacteria bacterium]
MKLSDRRVQIGILAGLLVFGGAVAYTGGWFSPPPGPPEILVVNVPELSPLAVRGNAAYDVSCAVCHGTNAAGTDRGPPLVNDIYNPGHHSDESFYRAVRQGVPQHHWTFGNMPFRPDVTDGELIAIVRYVRELQQANGIETLPHEM